MSAVAAAVDRLIAGMAPCVLPGGIPDEMLDRSWPPTDDGWFVWKPIPSTVTRAALGAFEARLGIRLPEPIRELLCHVHYLDLNAVGILFRRHPPDWQRAWRAHQKWFLENRQFSIGADDNGVGPVCLDLSQARADGDCPVVLIDHENGARTLLFSSTERMFACFALLGAKALVDPSPEDIAEFLNLDPQGAGGPGRDHWERTLPRRTRIA